MGVKSSFVLSIEEDYFVANQVDINQLAARGAAVRLAELQAEIDTIIAAFPTLRTGPRAGSRKGARKRSNGAAAMGSVGAAQPGRRRRAMSAAEKRAVSIRMKKYWAARRKAKAAAAK